jgi:hypothetical protein
MPLLRVVLYRAFTIGRLVWTGLNSETCFVHVWLAYLRSIRERSTLLPIPNELVVGTT